MRPLRKTGGATAVSLVELGGAVHPGGVTTQAASAGAKLARFEFVCANGTGDFECNLFLVAAAPHPTRDEFWDRIDLNSANGPLIITTNELLLPLNDQSVQVAGDVRPTSASRGPEPKRIAAAPQLEAPHDRARTGQPLGARRLVNRTDWPTLSATS